MRNAAFCPWSNSPQVPISVRGHQLLPNTGRHPPVPPVACCIIPRVAAQEGMWAKPARGITISDVFCVPHRPTAQGIPTLH